MNENSLNNTDNITVYHGGTEKIDSPICRFGRKNLDFGQGFYLTTLREQAETWANNMARSRNKPAIINQYSLNRAAIIKEARCKIFKAYDEEWLQFIVGNRTGLNLAEDYDYIEGGVANDRVIDTINLYLAGLIEFSSALKELSKHQPNNQICILNQDLIDKHLTFNGTEQL